MGLFFRNPQKRLFLISRRIERAIQKSGTKDLFKVRNETEMGKAEAELYSFCEENVGDVIAKNGLSHDDFDKLFRLLLESYTMD